ncbi:Fe-S-cluster-containing dehydrogenase component [Neobacillus niacini]|uniref:hypothetical protein n=1 Tax=Neobacillus driksii TaxID=3035913 RepID=UPI002782883C|nr:hypothetical protein [Neobacillus niacini]MDQ0974391.1 Fe-S-cluster-containing dehydrogenase component [Neobacillus niacini]
MATEYVKFVDVTKCDGCRACMVACKNWNDLPAEPQDFLGSAQSHTKTTADTWNVLQYIEHENSKGGLDYLFRHSACFHCTKRLVKRSALKMQLATLILAQLLSTMKNVLAVAIV